MSAVSFDIGPCHVKFRYDGESITKNKCKSYYCDKRLNRGPQGFRGLPGSPGANGGTDYTYRDRLIDCFNSYFSSTSDNTFSFTPTITSSAYLTFVSNSNVFPFVTNDTYNAWGIDSSLVNIDTGTAYTFTGISFLDPNFLTLVNDHLSACAGSIVLTLEYLYGVIFLLNYQSFISSPDDLQVAIWTLLYSSSDLTSFVNTTTINGAVVTVPYDTLEVTELIQDAVLAQNYYNATGDISYILANNLIPVAFFSTTGCVQLTTIAVDYTQGFCPSEQEIFFSSGLITVTPASTRTIANNFVIGNGTNNPIVNGYPVEYTAASHVFNEPGTLTNVTCTTDILTNTNTDPINTTAAPFTFTLMYSPGATIHDNFGWYETNPYTPTPLVVESTFGGTPNSISINTWYTSTSGANTTELNVSAGDRIAIQVSLLDPIESYNSINVASMAFSGTFRVRE